MHSDHYLPDICTSSVALDHRSISGIQANGGVHPAKQPLVSQSIGHGDSTIRTATMVAGRAANHRMDRIAVTNSVVDTLDQQTCTSFASAEACGFLVVRETSPMGGQCSGI